MYYRYEFEPKTQFLTAVIGKDGNSYFFYRNVRNLLDSRNIKDYCRSTLDDLAAPIIQVRDVLPQGNAVRFKYEHYFAIGEDTLQRIMDLYIQRIDRELYMWYLHMRVDKKVKLVQPEKFEKVLQVPYLSFNPAKMPRFVVCNSQDVDARFLLSDYLPLLINATLGYYREIERNRLMCMQQSEQQPDDAQSQPDALEEPPTQQTQRCRASIGPLLSAVLASSGPPLFGLVGSVNKVVVVIAAGPAVRSAVGPTLGGQQCRIGRVWSV